MIAPAPRQPNISFQCPICGYNEMPRPARSIDTGGASFEICPCCMFHFGYDDDSEGYSYSEWRGQWISGGMHYGLEEEQPPPGWDPLSQLVTMLARGEPELIIFSGLPTPDDTDRRAVAAVRSEAELVGLSRAWRQRPGDLGWPVRVFVAQVESGNGEGIDERINVALRSHTDRPYLVETIVAGQEQSRYRQLLIERAVALYTR